MSEVEDIFSEAGKKVGPLPVWAYAVLGGGTFVAFSYLRGRGGSSGSVASSQANTTDPVLDTAPPDPTIDPNAAGPYGGTAIGDFLANNPTGTMYPVGQHAQGLPAPVSNGQWARLASDYLVSLGAVPTDVGNAFANYLAGKPLSQTQQAIVNQANRYFGTAPEGVQASTAIPLPVPSPVKALPKPAPKPVIKRPTPVPPHHTTPQERTVIVGHWAAWNGSLFGIAQHFYGNGNRWHDVYNANRHVLGADPNRIFPGTVLRIP